MRRYPWLPWLVVLAVVATAAWALSEEPSRGSGLSSYRSGPDGGKGLAEAYSAAGRRVTRVRTATDRGALGALEPGTTLFVLAPTEPFSGDEARALRDWVESGQTVVVAYGQGEERSSVFGRRDPVSSLAGVLFPAVERVNRDTGTLSPRGVAPEALGWQRLPAARGALRLPPDAQQIAAGSGGTAVGVVRAGAGRVVVIGDPRLLTPRQLREPDGAAFALALAGGPVAFDEYHHGFRDEVRDVFGRRFWLVVLQLLAVTVVVFLARGRRVAPPRMETEDRPHSRATFADALAENLREADARQTALDLLRADLRRLVRARTLASPEVEDVELARRARAAGVDVDEALLGAAPTEKAFLLRARQVADAIAELQGLTTGGLGGVADRGRPETGLPASGAATDRGGPPNATGAT